MAWTRRTPGAQSAGNNASSLTPALPTGWAAGDLHVLVFSNFGGTNSRRASLPSGWTSVGGDTGWLNGTTNLAVYYRVAESGDSNPTVTLTGTGATGDTQLARVYGYSPASGTTPTLRTNGSTSTNASADNVGPISTMTPTAGDLALIVAAKSNDWNGTATLSSWSLDAQSESTTGNDAGNAVLYVLSWGGGATGDLTVTDNGGTASNGVGLGIMLAFYEAATAPTVTTQAVSSIGTTTATGNGNVTSDGGSTITERGVCWSTSTGPTTADSTATSAGTTGAYAPSMTGLTSNTHYYVRAYATNAIGTSYGAEVEFDTLPVFADTIPSIIAGLDSAQSEADGWDADVKAALVANPSSVVRTSDTVVTITLPAVAGYNITAQETITATIPAVALTGGADIVASPTFTVDTAASGSVNATPGVGALTVTGFAPSVQTPRDVQAGVGAGTFTGFAATVQTPRNVLPSVGAATLTGFAPTVVATANQTVTPGVGAGTFTGFGPSVQTPRNVLPGVGAATFDGFAPTASVSANREVFPATGALTVDGFAPTIQTPRNVLPSTGVGTFAGFAPQVSASSNTEVFPDTGALTATGYAPTLVTPRNVLPDTGAATFDGFAPTVVVAAAGIVNATPGTGDWTIDGYAPDASVTTYTISPPTVGMPGGPTIRRFGGGTRSQRRWMDYLSPEARQVVESAPPEEPPPVAPVARPPQQPVTPLVVAAPTKATPTVAPRETWMDAVPRRLDTAAFEAGQVEAQRVARLNAARQAEAAWLAEEAARAAAQQASDDELTMLLLATHAAIDL